MNIILENEEILDISASLQNDFLKGDKGDRGIQGEKGEKGNTGDMGLSNVLVIGTVEKGEEASATIIGESPNQILNLVLPKGDKGETGGQGKDGYNPIRGKDYWTEEDKEEIKSYIDNSTIDIENVLKDILETIQSGISASMIIEEIEQLIVSYFENKTVEEVEA